jgi:hypothetical protein
MDIMAINSYIATSPYVKTGIKSYNFNYLDFWTAPTIQSSGSDTLYKVEQKYNLRPDLLSYDLYNTVGYWWVFSIRNPDVIKDPIFDLTAGKIIWLPVSTSLPSSGS